MLDESSQHWLSVTGKDLLNGKIFSLKVTFLETRN